jgi:hypothetical protein
MFKLKSQSKILFVVVGLILAGAFSGAQAYQSQTAGKVKKVRQQIEFSEDVKVGSTVLKSGYYQVSSNDNQELTFRRMLQDSGYSGQFVVDTRTKPVTVKCTVTVLEAKTQGTRMDLPADSSGVHVLKSLTLDDTNLTFTIAQ